MSTQPKPGDQTHAICVSARLDGRLGHPCVRTSQPARPDHWLGRAQGLEIAVALFGGIVGGFAAGFLWSAQGTYFGLSAKQYAHQVRPLQLDRVRVFVLGGGDPLHIAMRGGVSDSSAALASAGGHRDQRGKQHPRIPLCRHLPRARGGAQALAARTISHERSASAGFEP